MGERPHGAAAKNRNDPIGVRAMETRNVDEVLTVRELARRLRVSERTLFTWTKQRGLPVVRVGKTLRFLWAHVREWLDSQTNNGGGNPGCGGVATI
jgi:excisionase family DNA binding protein